MILSLGDLENRKEFYNGIVNIKNNNDFKYFKAILEMIEQNSLINLQNSDKMDDKELRDNVSYYKAVTNIKRVLLNADRDLDEVIKQISNTVKKIEKSEKENSYVSLMKERINKY